MSKSLSEKISLFYILLSSLLSACGVVSTFTNLVSSTTSSRPANLSGTLSGPSTHFDAVGSSGGGCGIPDAIVDSEQNYVAMNVINTSGNYASFSDMGLSRPIPNSMNSIIGDFQNGKNCGRWVSVTFADICTSSSSGAPNQAICPAPGAYVSDEYNGASLNMVVTDSCTDSNAWCRDAPHHLDLKTASLNNFSKNGQIMPNPVTAGKFNNRLIQWSFISAPEYQGDILLYFAQNAKPIYYLPLMITHLENGIHNLEVLSNGSWLKTNNRADNGQIFDLATGGAPPDVPYQIRIYDANDQLVQNGRIYQFDLPSACGSNCSALYTPVTYSVH